MKPKSVTCAKRRRAPAAPGGFLADFYGASTLTPRRPPMEMLFVNERRAPRHAVPVDCQVVREDGFTMLGERAVDLSTCGMLVLSDVPAAIGEDVVVSLRIPGKE